MWCEETRERSVSACRAGPPAAPWRHARARAIPWLAVMALLGPGDMASAQPRGRVAETPALFIVRVPGEFDEVMTLLREAIQRRNYVVTGINELDETLERRAADVGAPPLAYERYKVVGFCNLTLADAAVRANPHVGAFLPCRAAVYRERGARETTIVAFRPSFLAAALGEGIQRVMRQVEADLLAILVEVAAD